MENNESVVRAIVDAAKEVVIQAIASGVDHEQCFEFLATKLGGMNARLIMAEIGLDRGLVEETEAYVKSF